MNQQRIEYEDVAPIFQFQPNPGAQMRVWLSDKPATYMLGSNHCGKTYTCVHLAVGCVTEHQNDEGYSYWPHLNADKRVKLYTLPEWIPMPPAPTKGSQIDRNDWLRPKHADWITKHLRDELGMKMELPTEVWLSEFTRELHRSITMMSQGRPFLPALLEGQMAHQEFSDVHGVWEYVELHNGSRLSLKTSKAQFGAYAGPTVNLIILDEPHPSLIVSECVTRVAKAMGRLVYICTPIVSQDEEGVTHDTESWRHIIWIKNNVLPLLDDPEAMKYNEIIHGVDIRENISLTPEFINEFVGRITHSGMSKELKTIRLRGLITIKEGIRVFDTDQIAELRRRLKDAPVVQEGYLDLSGRFA